MRSYWAVNTDQLFTQFSIFEHLVAVTVKSYTWSIGFVTDFSGWLVVFVGVIILISSACNVNTGCPTRSCLCAKSSSDIDQREHGKGIYD